MREILNTYPGGSILSMELGTEDIIPPCPGMGPEIGGPWPNGEPGGIPYWWLLNGWPEDEKWGFPPTNGGPEELGRPPNCGPLLDGEPYGLGPLKVGGPAEFEVGGKGCGPGPGVEEPDGAGEAVYCGVDEPVGGPEYGPPAGEPAPTGGPGNGDCPWYPAGGPE